MPVQEIAKPSSPGREAAQIGLSGPDITQAEIDLVTEVLRSGRLSLGPKVEEFESLVAGYCGTKHAIACSSGTSGLHLLMRSIGIKPGDEVITTPFSFVASSNCVMFEGGKPVFVDIDSETWNIDVSAVEDAVTARTRAMIPVHVFGQICDMEPLQKIAQRRGLRLIEDSCEALGATWRGKKAGSIGEAGVFGFYPNKQITTGEGGMIVTSDAEIARLCQSMRNQGRDSGMAWLAHDRLGYNYRLPDINCAVGIVQMRRVDEILAKRSKVAGWYIQRLSGESRVTMQRILPDCEISWFVLVVKLDGGYPPEARDEMIRKLRAEGIGCSNYFSPIHLQKYMMEQFGYSAGAFPVCEAVAARTIALPFHSKLSEGDVDRVCETVKKLL